MLQLIEDIVAQLIVLTQTRESTQVCGIISIRVQSSGSTESVAIWIGGIETIIAVFCKRQTGADAQFITQSGINITHQSISSRTVALGSTLTAIITDGSVIIHDFATSREADTVILIKSILTEKFKPVCIYSFIMSYLLIELIQRNLTFIEIHQGTFITGTIRH